MEEFSPLNIDGELQRSLESLEKSGIKVFTGEKMVGKTENRLSAVSDFRFRENTHNIHGKGDDTRKQNQS